MFKTTKLLSAAAISAMALFATSSQADTMGTPKISAMSILNGLENPWDMAFTSGGDMFYTEKCKGLSVKTSSGSVNALAGMKGAKGYASDNSDLFCSGQAGMMGVALDPNFNKNRRVYVASTSNKYHGSGCKDNFSRCDGNIIMRFEVSKDMKSVSNRVDIVKDIQYKPFESDHPFGGPGAKW
jgi:glucose/arabinose dehydrogenase